MAFANLSADCPHPREQSSMSCRPDYCTTFGPRPFTLSSAGDDVGLASATATRARLVNTRKAGARRFFASANRHAPRVSTRPKQKSIKTENGEEVEGTLGPAGLRGRVFGVRLAGDVPVERAQRRRTWPSCSRKMPSSTTARGSSEW
jgi:hypothetical protein